ncbi:uncharacterized protein LOC111892827 isoform X1 [Lactuca sativa]|uniref:Uncharacterized protein n=1 Tax=Lactuca sativa TaxID=4236 RepID=A0A9R1WQU8_LACSA|nr:uncharacterized protein LOC111892827 isoform X1 [Lactuca sativa]KAJ0187135.1 hypothetical protein LSAT_V11C900492890 [Lactuca sativa]
MEGIGSRTGRPSSRYGSAPVFTGPVRRWQKQWVHVSSSSSSITYNHSNNNSSNSNNNASTVRIRRWTPVSSAPSGEETESGAEERPRRKLRYAPIVVLEKKKESERTDNDVKEESKTHQPIAQETSETDNENERNFDDVLSAKSQSQNEPSTEDLNHQPMEMEEHDEDHDLGGENKVADWVKAAQRGFAR